MRGVPNHGSPTNVHVCRLESNKIEGVQYRRHISPAVVAVPSLRCLLPVSEGATWTGTVVHQALNKINENTTLFEHDNLVTRNTA